MLDKHHRVIGFHGRCHQAFRVVGIGWRHHLQAGQMSKETPQTLRMLSTGTDATTGGLNHDWHGDSSARHVMVLGNRVVHLIEADANEINEHDLQHRAIALER